MTMQEDYSDLPSARVIRARLAELAVIQDELAQAREAASRAEKERIRSERQAAKDAADARVQIDAAGADTDRVFAKLSATLRENAARRAIEAAGGNVALLLPLAVERLCVSRDDFALGATDAKGRPHYALTGKPGTVDDVVADLKRDPAMAVAFQTKPTPDDPMPTPPDRPWSNLTDHMREMKAKQAGTPAVAITGNPFAKGETWSLTDQCRLVKTDPERAARLKAEAAR